MPLVKSTGKGAFRKNIQAEVKAGKPVKQAVAIAYSVKRAAAKKGKKKPHGRSNGYAEGRSGRQRREQPGDKARR